MMHRPRPSKPSSSPRPTPGDIRAVQGVSFQVAPGEAFGLLGPNGAGKTTTIGMLNTTVTPTSGRAFLGGRDVAQDPIGTRAISSVVFQDSVVDQPLDRAPEPRAPPAPVGHRQREGRARLARLADVVGITEILDRPVATYSGGQRRRMEIVRALLSDPQVLFLDEPTVGLDTRVRHDLFDVLATLRDQTGRHDSAHHPLPRRSRAAVRSDRHRRRRPHRRLRDAGPLPGFARRRGARAPRRRPRSGGPGLAAGGDSGGRHPGHRHHPHRLPGAARPATRSSPTFGTPASTCGRPPPAIPASTMSICA